MTAPDELMYICMLIVYVYSIRDAYKSAIKINEFLVTMSKEGMK
jgi:hypothetical protein